MTRLPGKIILEIDRSNPHMKRHEKINECEQPAPRPRRCNFVYFLMAVATIWAALVFAPQGFAATGTMKSAGENVQILYPADTGAGTALDSRKLEPPVFSSRLSGCCGQTRDHKEMPGSCQMSCPAPGCDLSAIQAWLSPALAFHSVRFSPIATGAPNSLLHQRLNRPPIIDRLA